MDGGGESITAAKEVRGLKKGPWTATEDAILTEYVRKHGEGNWNAVQKNSGLLRCGKSCRLRWANHLRPNLKKGSFSPDEERLIIELHAKHGNKWARMASQLPGRTDNEIKNYWNTRMKRRQRAGLPLYPQEIHQGVDLDVGLDADELVSFGFQSQEHHQNMNPNSSNTPSSSSSFSSSSSQPPKRLCLDPSTSYNPSLNQISDSPMNYSSMFSLYNNTFHDHQNDNNNRFGFSLPLSSSSSSSNELSNPNHLLEFNNGNNIDVLSYSSLLMGDHYNHHEDNITPNSFLLQNLELPSNQTTSNTNKNGVFLDPPAANSGLLDALLMESQVLSRGGISKVSLSDSNENQDNKRVKIGDENRLIDNLTSSTQSSIGTNPNSQNKNINEARIGNDENDDDDDDAFLMSLLNNFPASTSLPWRIENQFEGSNNLASPTGIYLGNSLVDPVTVQTSSSVDPMTSLGSCNWSNMPRIC